MCHESTVAIFDLSNFYSPKICTEKYTLSLRKSQTILAFYRNETISKIDFIPIDSHLVSINFHLEASFL